MAGSLVDTAWLAEHREEVRVTEATAYLDPPIKPGKPYHPRAGRAEYDAGHIPGAGFADLVEGLAEPDPVGFLARVRGVSREDMALVAGGNAERLLGLKASAKV